MKVQTELTESGGQSISDLSNHDPLTSLGLHEHRHARGLVGLEKPARPSSDF
jgi:hypothetical protein